MPFAENNGVRIRYTVEGQGPPLILHHGFGECSDDWHRAGYVDALVGTYTVILIDARGHGQSDKPRERAAYEWPVQVWDVISVLDQLQISRAAFWGYSMGGEIGFALALNAPERVSALLCGGASAHASDLGSAFRGIDGADPDAFLNRLAARVGVSSFSAEAKARLLQNDLAALVAAAQDRPSMEHLLPNLKIACLLYAGQLDKDVSQTMDCARCIPHVTCIVVPNLDHGETFDRSDVVLPHAMRFMHHISSR